MCPILYKGKTTNLTNDFLKIPGRQSYILASSKQFGKIEQCQGQKMRDVVRT